MSVENYVVIGITLATITVCCQLIFLPFLFSEIDSIRGEFDREIKEAMIIFESSYESLAVLRPSSIRREREAVNRKFLADSTSTGPADHRTLPPQFRIQAGEVKRIEPKFSQVINTFKVDQNSDNKDQEEDGEAYDITDYETDIATLSPVPLATSKLQSTAQSPGQRKENVNVQNPSSKTKSGALPICPLSENRCPAGPPGPPGLSGIPGTPGADGHDGAAGMDATDQMTPSYVSVCVTCPAGPEGKQGIPGPPGKPGLAGANGIPGPSGKFGQPGSSGDYGPPGRQGPMGTRGPPGAVGMDGVVTIPNKGPKGTPGKAGSAGQAGEDGTNNNTPGPQGLVGLPGFVGKAGQPGLTGKRGEVGYQGALGERANCKCDELIKRAIAVAQNRTYVALEKIVRSEGVEIRRKPQNSQIPIEVKPENDQEESFAILEQEDDRVLKFAVAPSDFAISEPNLDVLPPQGSSFAVNEPEISASLDETLTGPSSSPAAPIKTTLKNIPQSMSPSAVHIPISPPRAVAPRSSMISSRSKFKSTPVSNRSHGESRKIRIRGRPIEKGARNRGEGPNRKPRRIVRVKRVDHIRAKYIRRPPNVRPKSNDQAFVVEDEIARNGVKKVVQREAVMKMENQKKDIKTVNAAQKKLRRVELTPSSFLANQQKQNSNILENIARSLGIIDEKQTAELKRVQIP